MAVYVYYKGERRGYRGKEFNLHRIDVASDDTDEALGAVSDALAEEKIKLRTPLLALVQGGKK